MPTQIILPVMLSTSALARSPAAMAAFALPPGSTSIFNPAGTSARSIFHLSLLVFGITGAIFLIVAGLLLYALLRFRRRAGDPHGSEEPQQIYGSTQIELSWTVIPILIVVMLFLATARIIFATQDAPKPANALDVTVVGHQFWWEFRYPKLGIVTANELHIPASDAKAPTKIYLTMTSADTDHSFWVPRLAGKTDVIPNRINSMWLDADAPGLYVGQCAQYCGIEHAEMLVRVYAETPADYAAWVAHQQQPAVDDPSVAAGRAVFEHNACISCHTVRGTVATGTFGPDLTHLASRDTIASGYVPLTREKLRAFIADPGELQARRADAADAPERPRPRPGDRVPDDAEVRRRPWRPRPQPSRRQWSGRLRLRCCTNGSPRSTTRRSG